MHLQGKIFHNCLVDTRSNLNLISKAACLEAGFTPPKSQDEEEDDQAIVVGFLEGVCILAVGSKEQYSLDFTIVDFPRTRCFTPIQLGKQWVDSLLSSNPISSYMQKDQMDKEHLPSMTSEPEEPYNIEDEDERENIQEVQEYEFATSVYLRNVKFPDYMISHRINFNPMTYKACKGAGFIPTTTTKEDLAQIDNIYQMLGILKDVPISSSESSPRHLMDIWVIKSGYISLSKIITTLS